MKKSRIIAVALVLFVSIMLICILPWPTHVEVKMTGSLLYGQEVVEEPVYVTVQGYVLDYLFRQDQVSFRFIQSGMEDWILQEDSERRNRIDEQLGASYIISTCGVYKRSENRMGPANYAFSADDGLLLIYIYDDTHPIIACSVGGEKTPTEIMARFSDLTELFSLIWDAEQKQQEQTDEQTRGNGS